MLEIGKTVESLQLGSDEGQIAGIAASLNYNKLVLLEGTNIVDFGAAANSNVVLGWVYYAKWRIIGIGWRCHTENFTDAQDPELSFGSAADAESSGRR